MRKGFLRIGIVLGVILLFVGAGILPSISESVVDESANLMEKIDIITITYDMINIDSVDWNKLELDYNALLENEYAMFEITQDIEDLLDLDYYNYHWQSASFYNSSLRFFTELDNISKQISIVVVGNSSNILRSLLPAPRGYLWWAEDSFCNDYSLMINLLNATLIRSFENLKQNTILNGDLSGTSAYSTSLDISNDDNIYIFGYGVYLDYHNVKPWSRHNNRVGSGSYQTDIIDLSTNNHKYSYFKARCYSDNSEHATIYVNGDELLNTGGCSDESWGMAYESNSIQITLTGEASWSNSENDIYFVSIGNNFEIILDPTGQYYYKTIQPDIIDKTENNAFLKVLQDFKLITNIHDTPDIVETNVYCNTGDYERIIEAPDNTYFYKIYFTSQIDNTYNGHSYGNIYGYTPFIDQWIKIEGYNCFRGFPDVNTYDFYSTSGQIFSKIKLVIRSGHSGDQTIYDLSLWHGQIAPPSIVYVDDDYTSSTPGWLYDHFNNIQEGVDAVCEGGTVYVADGTYNELITIDKPLTLLGATNNVCKKGYPVPSGYAWDDTVESIIQPPAGHEDDLVVYIYDTDNVTFKGFIIQALERSSSGNRMLIHVEAQTQNIENLDLSYNVIGPNTNLLSQDGNKGRMNLDLDLNPYDASIGITDSLISCNKIFDSKGNGDNIFIWGSYHAYGATGPSPMTNTYIEDNEICGAHRCGIETAGGHTGLVIRNNDIHSNSGNTVGNEPNMLKYGTGILMIRGASDKIDCDGYGPFYLLIEDNNIYNNEKNGIYMGPKNQDVTIQNNNIYNNGWDGIRLDLIGNYWNPDFDPNPGPYTCLDGSANVVAYGNNIYSNVDHGVQVIGTPSNGFILDATCNWWGDVSGPSGEGSGTGDGVSTNVIYCPWLDDEYPYGDCIGGATVHNIDSDEWFCCIQCAIDDDETLDCHTIEVFPGTYVEQILISKSLTILGQPGAIIQAPAVMNSYTIAESTSTWYPIIFAYGGTMIGNAVSGAGTISVTIDGFEIDGLDQTGPGRYVGIFYRNIKPGCAGNTISNNDIHSMGVDGRATFGIEVRGDSDVTIEDNAVTGFSKGGIGLNGNAGIDPDPTGFIQDNTITGAGQTTPQTWAPNGIQVSYGASCSIIGNEVSACGWPGTAWSGTGILVGDTSDVLIDDNYIYDCEQAIGIGDYPASWGAPFILTCSDITASNNVLDANSWGISIFNDVINTLVEGNDIQNTVYDGIDVYNYGYGDDSPDGTVIVDNIIAYCGNGYDAIWLGENQDTAITRNYIHDNTNAIHIDGDSHDTMIEYNWILENDVGILVTESGGFEPDGIEAYYNYIYSNCAMDTGIDNQVSNMVEATHNWFGVDGPCGGIADAVTGRIADGSGEQVIGSIHFDPWAGVEASGSVTPTGALIGDIIHYDASDSFAYGGSIGPADWNPDNYNYVLDGTPLGIQYFWDFDDGLYSFQQSGAHIYDSSGTYTVVLRVRALDGYLDQTDGYYGGDGFLFDFKQFTVTVSSPSTALAANADAGDFGGYEDRVEESIQFYGSATGGMPPYTYSWDFDDGSTSDLQDPMHTYETEGTYIATLTVTDNDGTSVEDTAEVTVYSPDELLANAGGPYASMVNEAIQFQGTASGGIDPYTFVWDFGDGSPTIQAQYPTYVYNEDGIYIATLTVTDDKGNTDDHTAKVTIIKESGDTAEIKNIEGGLGVKATIQAGDEPVDWAISIEGKYVFYGGYADGRIDANAIQTVKIPFSLGIGKVDITVTANLVVEERTGFMLGPFILSVK